MRPIWPRRTLQAEHAWPDHRRLGRPARQQGAAHGASDARAAHQARAGHVKYLYGSGVVGYHGRFYAVYHGAEGLRNIAGRIHSTAGFLAKELEKLGYTQLNKDYFDTLKIQLPSHVSVNALREIALECKVNLRYFDAGQIGISLDETTGPTDIGVLLYIFAGSRKGLHAERSRS